MIWSVSRGTLALALQDQVTPRRPSSRAMASARGRSSVKVSSSKKNSFTCGNAAFAQAISSTTWPRLRLPGRVPEGLDLALGLVARPGAAVEAVEGRSLQKQSSHHLCAALTRKWRG